MLDQLAQGLQTLGSGLQNSAGIYDPTIFQMNVQQGYDKQKLVAGAVIKAVENGALDPQKGQAILQKIGYADVPLGVSAQTAEIQRKTAQANEAMSEEARIHRSIFGAPDMGLDQSGNLGNVADESNSAASVERDEQGNIISASAKAPQVTLTAEKPEDKYRRFVDALMQSPNPDVREKGLALKKELDTIDKPISVGPGHELVTPAGERVYANQQPDQAHTTQAERALQTLRNYQLIVNVGGKLTQAQQLEADSARSLLSQLHYGIDPVTGNLYASQGLTPPASITVGASGTPNSNGVPVNRLPSLEGGRKGLDAGTEKDLNGMGDSRAQLTNIVSTFKPDYAGLGLGSEAVARAELEAGRRGALDRYQPAAQWWEKYEQYVTDVRAAKFGMALTGPELAQFERYRANPSQSDKEVHDNIQRQQQILDNAIQRRLQGINTSGQNLKQAEAIAGTEIRKLPNKGTIGGYGYELQDDGSVRATIPGDNGKPQSGRFQTWKQFEDYVKKFHPEVLK